MRARLIPVEKNTTPRSVARSERITGLLVITPATPTPASQNDIAIPSVDI
jgi:hypothetical protein